VEEQNKETEKEADKQATCVSYYVCHWLISHARCPWPSCRHSCVYVV